MLTTVDGSNHNGIRVQVVTENLSRIGQLEDALTNLWDGSVDLIEKEEACVVETNVLKSIAMGFAPSVAGV